MTKIAIPDDYQNVGSENGGLVRSGRSGRNHRLQGGQVMSQTIEETNKRLVWKHSIRSSTSGTTRQRSGFGLPNIFNKRPHPIRVRGADQEHSANAEVRGGRDAG